MWFLEWGWIPVVYILIGVVTGKRHFKYLWSEEIQKIKRGVRSIGRIPWGEMKFSAITAGMFWPAYWTFNLIAGRYEKTKANRIAITKAIIAAHEEEKTAKIKAKLEIEREERKNHVRD